MRKYLAALALALPFAMAGAAHAAGPWYGEIGYTRTDIDSDVKADFNDIDLRGGVQFGHWGGEMEVGAGLGNASTTILGSSVDVKMNYEVGVYAVGHLPLARGLDLFARVGAVGAEFHESVGGGGNGSNRENGYAVGAGLRYFPMGGANGVRVEYTRYGMQDDANNLGVSFVHKF
jgi:hypothetical protein